MQRRALRLVSGKRLPAYVKRRLRALAPRHPVGPEMELRLIMLRLISNLQAAIKSAALRYVQQNKGQRGDSACWREDGILDALKGIKSRAKETLKQSERAIANAATRTARSAIEQIGSVTKSARVSVEKLRAPIDKLTDHVLSGATELIDKAATRAAATVAEWSARAGEDLGALGLALDEALGGALSKGADLASRAFARGFGEMTRDVQKENSEPGYMWVAINDAVVREEHKALMWEICSWDDPPLKASESSNGEDCHPGDDYNCRCVAVPLSLVADVAG